MNVGNECIPLFEPGQRITGQATAAVTGKRLVTISGDRTAEGLIRVAHAADNLLTDDAGQAIGVSSHDCASGAIVTIIGSGAVVPVDPSVNVTAGAKLAADDAGKVKPAADTETVVGIAFSTAVEADGDDVLVKLL